MEISSNIGQLVQIVIIASDYLKFDFCERFFISSHHQTARREDTISQQFKKHDNSANSGCGIE
jgi:ferritin